MKPDESELIGVIAFRVTGEKLDVENLARQLKLDGGLDMEHLCKNQIVDILLDKFSGDWSLVAFGFSELLTYYNSTEENISDMQIVAWCASILIVGRLCREGRSDWGIHMPFILDGLKGVLYDIDINDHLAIISCLCN